MFPYIFRDSQETFGVWIHVIVRHCPLCIHVQVYMYLNFLFFTLESPIHRPKMSVSEEFDFTEGRSDPQRHIAAWKDAFEPSLVQIGNDV